MTERFVTIDFDGFHTVDLPRRLADDEGLLTSADGAGLRSLAFRRDDGRAYS